MPNFDERRDAEDDLEVTARVMHTVERQIGSYRASLEKVRLLRKEFALDSELAKKTMSSPENMSKLLVERGVPEHLAVGMAGEDFKDREFGGRLGIWTWDCCCTGCCLTECHCTLITSIGVQARD
jgi:hypothetical protein